MSRNKTFRLLSFALAVLLLLTPAVSASGPEDEPEKEPQDIIDLSQIEQEETKYQTAEVVRGTLTEQVYTVATKHYPKSYDIRFEYGNAKFVEYTVSVGDEVKSGDILARFAITGSDAEYTRMKLDLQRTQEQTSEGIRERQRQIDQKNAQLAQTSDEYEKAILELTVKKMKIELEQYKYRQQRMIDQKSEACSEEGKRRTTDVLVSPVDGVVRQLTYKSADDPVSPSESLLTVSAEQEPMFVIPNETGALRYNMPVEFQIGSSPDATYLPGRIIAADDVLPMYERTGYALVQLDPYDEEKYDIKVNGLKVIAERMRMEDVLIVPRGAMVTTGGERFVNKLVDGSIKKQRIAMVGSGDQGFWALEGVEEGETLVLE